MIRRILLLLVFVWAVGTAKSYTENLAALMSAKGTTEATVADHAGAGLAAALWPADVEMPSLAALGIQLPDYQWWHYVLAYLGLSYVIAVPMTRRAYAKRLVNSDKEGRDPHYHGNTYTGNLYGDLLGMFALAPIGLPCKVLLWTLTRGIVDPATPKKS